MIDLHMHTKYSDGTDGIIDILKKAEQKNLSNISITDHNTVTAYEALENINVSKYFSGNIIVGIELNTKILDIPIEILGYNFDYKLLQKEIPNIYISAEKRNMIECSRLYKKCINIGIKIDEKDFLSFNGSCFASKFIHTLIIKNIDNKKFIDEESWNNSSVFYRKYMSNPNTLLYVEMDDIVPDFKTASDLIRKCGGLVFIPHIFEYRDNSIKILNYILENYNIDGIECYYTTFTQEQTSFLVDLCQSKNLLISGGSDYHGSLKPNVDLGTGLGNLSISENILDNWKRN